MKTTNLTKAISAFSGLLFFFSTSVAAQQTEADIKTMVESHQFIFIAEYAMPMNGNNVSLNGDQDLTVSADSVVANLPYYGSANQAPMGSDQGDINFASAKFKYTSTVSKKDGWDIVIVPKDIFDDQKLSLHVSSNGKTTLQVTNVNRQPISFTGYLKENTRSKKAS